MMPDEPTHHIIDIIDGSDAKDSTVTIIEKEKFAFIVTSPHGLFKNGQQYNQGETIMLTADTARPFLRNRDIEPKEGTK